MKYHYVSWLLRLISAMAILETAWLELRWGPKLYKNGMWYSALLSKTLSQALGKGVAGEAGGRAGCPC